MNDKVLQVLEYNKIRAKLTDFAASSLGKEMAAALVPSDHLTDIVLNQQETADAFPD